MGLNQSRHLHKNTLRKHRLIIVITKILENIQMQIFLNIAHLSDLASNSTNGESLGRDYRYWSGRRCLKTTVTFAFQKWQYNLKDLWINNATYLCPSTKAHSSYRLKIHGAAGGEVSASPYNELCHISMAQQRLWLSHVTFHSPQQPLRAPVNHQKVRTAPPSLAYSGFTDSSVRLKAWKPYWAEGETEQHLLSFGGCTDIYLERKRLRNNRCNRIKLCESFSSSFLMVVCINLHLYNAYASSAYNSRANVVFGCYSLQQDSLYFIIILWTLPLKG